MRSRPSKRRLLIPMLILALSSTLGLSACNLISVATLVGKKFVPALAKGDRKTLQKHSSHRLAYYWGGFTKKEIENAVSGPTGRRPKGPGGKQAKRPRQKRPGVSLVSFKVKQGRAVLVARMGKSRFRFECVRQDGRWKVDDIAFTMRGKTSQLSRMLKLLLAAKSMKHGIETGSRYLLVNVSTERMRRQVWDRLTDNELKLFTRATRRRPLPPGARPRPRTRITTEVRGDRSFVKLTGSSLPAVIELVDRGGQYRVDVVKLGVGGQWHSLSAIVHYLTPTLNLYRWAEQNLIRPGVRPAPTTQELSTLIRRLRATFSRSLWQRTFAWLSPADLKPLPWKTLRKAVQAATRPRPPKLRHRPPKGLRRASLSPKSIKEFRRVGNELRIKLALPMGLIHATLRLEDGAWRLHAARLQSKKQNLELGDLLATLAPVARLTAQIGRLGPTILAGGSAGNQALVRLLEALKRASSADLNARLWSRIPRGLLRNIPHSLLPRALRALIPPAAERAGAPRKPRPGARRGDRSAPGIELLQIDQQPRRVTLSLRIARQRIRVLMIKEATGWKIDDVVAPIAGKPRSLKLVAGMIAPAAALGHAVLAGNADALREAVTPELDRRVVKPLLRILGHRFGALMHTVRQQAFGPQGPQAERPPTRTSPPSAPPRPKQPGLSLKSLTFDKSSTHATIVLGLGPKTDVTIQLANDAKHIWRIDDVSFPLGGRTLTLRSTGPILVPLVGFGVSLLALDLRGVRAASSYAFNRSVWYKLRREKFRKLIGQFLPKPKRRAGKRPPMGHRRAGKRKGPQLPRLLALRIRDKARWPWAEVELMIAGKEMRVSLIGSKQGVWKVHDVHVTLGGVAISVKKLLALTM
ncbi:MAG: hypothetical protein ABI333_10675 [bacterium]